MPLKEYRKKRNFKTSPEPGPVSGRKTGSLPVFVIHEHHASHLHYDLRLEAGGVLKSWAIPKGPPLSPDVKHLAVMVDDHPLDYASFKGAIPEGNYGAGVVKIWDNGTYSSPEANTIPEETVLEGIKNGKFHFVLHGRKLQGEYALIRLKRGKGNNWLIIKKKLKN